MAVIPTPATATALGEATAADFNTHKDAVNFLYNPPRCVAGLSSSPTIPTGTATLISWTSESVDSDTMHSTVTNTSRITANTAGLFHIIACVSFSTSGTGLRRIQCRKNAAGSAAGGTLLATDTRAAVSSGSTQVALNFYVSLAVNDYIEIFVTQESGGNLTLGTELVENFFSAKWVAVS